MPTIAENRPMPVFFGKHIYRLRAPSTANGPELAHRPRAGPKAYARWQMQHEQAHGTGPFFANVLSCRDHGQLPCAVRPVPTWNVTSCARPRGALTKQASPGPSKSLPRPTRMPRAPLNRAEFTDTTG
jgi:hypothetical protein